MLIFALKLVMPIKHSLFLKEGVGVICERADGNYGMFKPLQTAFRSLSAAQDEPPGWVPSWLEHRSQALGVCVSGICLLRLLLSFSVSFSSSLFKINK